MLQELRDRSLTDAFNFNGAYPYTRTVENQIAGRNDSWAVRWHASAFLADKLTLYPGHSLVRNIGHYGSGTHGGATGRFEGALAQQAPDLSGLVLEESAAAQAAFERFFQKLDGRSPAMSSNSLFSRVVRGLGGRVLGKQHR